jgi:4-amino-4-deoxy-L-arabinose transferase-like glycosyltransferase
VNGKLGDTRGFLSRVSEVPGIRWYIALTGLALSLAFTFIVYPAITDTHHAVLDPDSHGPLGFGLWKYHTFSYYPSTEPASSRGPMYPAFIAGMLALTGGWWPYSVQLAQCVLFGLLCALVFWTARTLWDPPRAVLAAALCAIDPLLIWYTSRILIETLMLLLFTGLIASVVLVKRRPTPWTALLVGAMLGLCVMTKSIYTPFLLLTPLLLLLPFGKPVRPTLAALVLVSGIILVAPWTVRNGRLTGIYTPEVGNTGFTLHQGNDFVEDFAKAPFSVSGLHVFSIARMREESDSFDLPPDLTGLRQRNALDAARRKMALEKLEQSPGFFLKKIVYDSFLFWTLGDSAGKSIFIASFQLPLLAAFCATLIVRRGLLLRGAAGICAALIALFYFAHLPTIALARYSVVLVPAMLIVAVGLAAPRPARSAVLEPIGQE